MIMTRLNRLMWPGLPIVLIASIMAMHAVMLVVVTSDPSFAVDETYRNGHGLDRIKQQRASLKLGWRADVTFEPATREKSILAVLLVDNAGEPITDALVHARVFHKTRASEALTVECLHNAGGRYVAPIAATREGRWECRLTVERGEDVFRTTKIAVLTRNTEEAKP